MADTQHTLPTSVYRYYDHNGLLLYVGITSRGIKRQYEHNETKIWWPYVDHQEVEHYEARSTAIDRERALIRQFRPPFNKQHNPDNESIREAYLNIAVNKDGTVRDISQRLGHHLGKTVVDMGFTFIGNQLILTSKHGEASKLIRLDPTDVANTSLGCHTKMKARLRLQNAYVTNGILTVNLTASKRLPDLERALVMLRQPNNGRAHTTMKRIDLYGTSAKLPEVSRG